MVYGKRHAAYTKGRGIVEVNAETHCVQFCSPDRNITDFIVSVLLRFEHPSHPLHVPAREWSHSATVNPEIGLEHALT
jgi:hypothetical protein